MGKPKVFVTRIIPNEGLDQIRAFCDATVWEDELPPSREVILRETHDADGLVSLLTTRSMASGWTPARVCASGATTPSVSTTSTSPPVPAAA
jgi:hypothetical protein